MSLSVTDAKLIYLPKRNPRLTREQFVRRWRQHAAFAMGLARWSSIQRCAYWNVLPPIPGVACPAADYDGVAMSWFRDSNGASSEHRARLRADRLETFSDYVEMFSLDLPGGGRQAWKWRFHA